MGNHRFVQLDVFTREPFAGNPLAVFPEAGGLTDEEMMKIAREMNLSETVFVLKPDEGEGTPGGANGKNENAESNAPETEVEAEPRNNSGTGVSSDNQATIGNAQLSVLRRLRIFTPAREIPFAGHPVVGSWNALAREGIVPLPEGGNGWSRIHHELGIGILPVDIEFKDGAPVKVVMTQGKFEIMGDVDDWHEQAELARALGACPRGSG